MNEYPRETKEFVPFEDVTVNGVPSTDFDYQVTPIFDRTDPDNWAAASTVDGEQVFLLDASVLGPGKFKAWVKVTDTPEEVVIEAGEFTIT